MTMFNVLFCTIAMVYVILCLILSLPLITCFQTHHIKLKVTADHHKRIE